MRLVESPRTSTRAGSNGNGFHAPDFEPTAEELRDSRADGDEVQQLPTGAIITPLAGIEPQAVKWLWERRIGRGKINLIFGDPGLGKSFLTIDFLARVSVGGTWPDGAPCEAGNVLIASAEDDIPDTIVPRFIAAGADMSKVFALEGIRSPGAEGRMLERSFTLGDIGHLADAMAKYSPRAVVIDPVSAFLGGKDGHRNDEIRGLLAPLAKLASTHDTAVLMVTHMSKGGGGRAMYRAMGSLAFAAAARSAWLVARDEAQPTRRLMLPTKNNIGDDQTGFAFSIRDGAIAWESSPVTMTADQAIAANNGDGTPGPEPEALNAAREWLSDYLANGAIEVKQVESDAKAAGISKRTLRRAKEAMGIRSRREAFGGMWSWALKEQPRTTSEHYEPSPEESMPEGF